MKITIITSIRNLLLKDSGFIPTPLFTIHSHPSEKERIIDKTFMNCLGIKAIHSLRQNMFAYQIIEIDESVKDKAAIIEELNLKTYSTAKAIESFLLFLWFVKDNSLSGDDTYGYVSEAYPCGFVANHTIYSNSSGLFESIEFSEEEFNRAISILFKYMEVSPDKTIDEEAKVFLSDNTDIQGKDIYKSGVSYIDKKNNLQRAIYFLSTVRGVPFLPLKISFYMPLLESLFSCGEKYHVLKKVSKRVAHYIAKQDDERNEIIGTISEAYDIRSRFLHGETLDSDETKLEYLKQLSNRIDKVVRAALTKVIMEDSQSFLQPDPKQFLNSLAIL
jgi:hypothetical protein